METLLLPDQATAELPGTRILILAPHPDDEVFGCGGAIMRHVARGRAVKVLIFTDGGHGIEDEKLQDYIATRQAESRAAAALLGYGEPVFLGHADRSLAYGEKLVAEITAAIGEHGADLVYAPSVYEMHPDHRALGMAAVEALRRLGGSTRLALYEIGMPLRPNRLLDISDLVARKQQAMACFASQNARQRYDLDIAALNRYRTYSLPANVEAAEAYLLVAAHELEADPLGLHVSEHRRQRALALPMEPGDLPLVSVIIRSMDRSSLAVALDSVALQTYPNIEVVVVNARGGTHTPLGEWCGSYPLRLVGRAEPLARAMAANAGLDAARGELAIFLDDDDCFLPHHIATLQECLQQHPHIVAAYAATSCLDESGKEIRRFARPFDAMDFRIENFIPIHAMLFRLRHDSQAPRFDESLQVCEDWEFWLQLANTGPFRYVPGTGALYNMSAEAGSGVWMDPSLARQAMLQIYRKWLPQWDDQTLWGLFEYARYRPLYDEQVEQNQGQQLKIVELEQQVSLLKQSLETRLEENRGLAVTVAAREAHINALLNSSSWRITRPLRALARLLRPGTAPGENPPTSAAPAPQDNAVQSQPAQLHVYDYAVDLKARSVPAFVLELTGSGKRVLEVGCGPGSITKVLANEGHCRVTGVELDAAAIELARPHCERIVQADLNDSGWPHKLGKTEPFDVVVAADVLEHLYDPWKTLRRMTRMLKPSGHLVISLPHACHAALAACLVAGDIQYRDWGLLDRTHIRFFGLKNIDELFAQADLKIIDARFVVKPPEETEFAPLWRELDPAARQALADTPHADIYQVVVKAVPRHRDGTALSLGALR